MSKSRSRADHQMTVPVLTLLGSGVRIYSVVETSAMVALLSSARYREPRIDGDQKKRDPQGGRS